MSGNLVASVAACAAPELGDPGTCELPESCGWAVRNM